VRAVWYDQQGPAADVLEIGDLPDPQPGPGEVRVRLRYSGINPGDTKKRRGWLGSTMPYPRVIPHSDGSGVIDQIGPGVDTARVGRRVWVYGAQSYRAFGTAAQYAVVPDKLAADLPDEVDDRIGACLGIPGITAHRAVFADGAIDGATVLVHGALGAVGSLAAQLAPWAGASVITTVRRTDDLPKLQTPAMAQAVALDVADPADAAAPRPLATLPGYIVALWLSRVLVSSVITGRHFGEAWQVRWCVMASDGAARPTDRAIETLSRLLDGYFRDPSTGDVVLYEQPNGKIKAVGVLLGTAAVLRRARIVKPGYPFDVFAHRAAMAMLFWWSVDELRNGTTKYRKTIGAVTLIGALSRTVQTEHARATSGTYEGSPRAAQ
jgi:threonine dehydrogenase-like Zn-dependent dehydrogenase